MKQSELMTRYLPLSVATLAVSLPFLLALSTSLKPLSEINNGSLFALPHAATLSAWTKAWDTACIGETCKGISPSIANSVIIVIPSLIASISCGALAGFALTLNTSRALGLVFAALLVGLFVPIQVALFPMIIAMRDMSLFGTITGVILIHTLWGLPLVTLLFRNSLLSLPKDMLRAARVDGIGFFSIFFYIVLPVSLPACGVALVLQFTYLWNEFLLNLTFAGTGHEPVMVALNILAGAQYGAPAYNVDMAAAFIAAAPTILVYLLSGPLFIKGIGTGAVKG